MKKNNHTALSVLSSRIPSVFMCGGAGVGKTTAIQNFIETTKENVIIVSPTGAAAINSGGSTIHSQFQLPPGLLIKKEQMIHPMHLNSPRRIALEMTDTIVLDEVSMVRADLMDAIDYSLRLNCGINKPFAGKKIRLVGDLYQLAPVLTDTDSGEFSTKYNSPFFMSADVFKKLNLKNVELTKVYRQKDNELIAALNAIRIGQHTQANLDYLNQRVQPGAVNDTLLVTPYNDRVNHINQQALSNLNVPGKLYKASITGKYQPSEYPTDQSLALKEGAQVMFTKNDPMKRFVNGTIGKVYNMNPASIEIMLKDESIIEVERARWDKFTYNYSKLTNSLEKEVTGTFQQFPLKLAWAITIHKSQGATLEKMHLDIDRGVFAAGQLYVGLSRVTNLSGLTLEKPITAADIKVDSRITNYFKQSKLIKLC